MAYQSNESGRAEIYVHEFPEARTKWQVSTGGGTQAHWRSDGKELFYRAGTSLMAVPVATGSTFTIGSPVRLFETRFAAVTVRGHYRAWPDGQRFLVLAPLARDLGTTGGGGAELAVHASSRHAVTGFATVAIRPVSQLGRNA
jgi:hypothetical protein